MKETQATLGGRGAARLTTLSQGLAARVRGLQNHLPRYRGWWHTSPRPARLPETRLEIDLKGLPGYERSFSIQQSKAGRRLRPGQQRVTDNLPGLLEFASHQLEPRRPDAGISDANLRLH